MKINFALAYRLKRTLIIFSVLLASLWKTGLVFGQCANPPVGCNGTNLANTGISSTNDFTKIEYDNYVSAFHSTIVRTGNGSFVTWGELTENAGSTSNLSPVEINSTNYPALTGTPLKAGCATRSSNTFQGILLTTTGLFAWGFEGTVIDASLTSSRTFQKLTIGGNTAGLPIGIAPGEVKMMYVGAGTIAITTCSGNVWVLSQDFSERGNGGLGSSLAWSRVTTNAAGNPDLSGIVVCRGAGNSLMALKNDGTVWVWGTNIYLGNNTGITAQFRAVQMTAPSGITPKMIAVNFEGNSQSHSYYILATNGSLYALGNNFSKQLGDWTNTTRLSWVQPRYTSSSGPVMNNIKWISTNEHDNGDGTANSMGRASVNVINADSVLYAFGNDQGNMIGRSGLTLGSPGNNPTDPGIPLGLVASDRILSVETGGHTSMAVERCRLNFGYVGHRINGSMGNGSPNDVYETNYTFLTANVQVCGAETRTKIDIKTPAIFPSATGNQCKDGQIVLQASPPGGTLSLVSGPAILSNDTLKFTGVGNAIVKYKIANVCGRTDSVLSTYIGEECLDTIDADNVPNYLDLDNDNDGILDSVECPLTNRVSNGDFSAGLTGWSPSPGWTLSGAVAVNTTDGPYVGKLSQTISTLRVPNARVILSFDIHSNNLGASTTGTLGIANMEFRIGGTRYLIAQNDTSMLGKIYAFNGAIIDVDTFIVSNNLTTNWTRVTANIPYAAANTALFEIVDSVISGGDDFRIDNISVSSSFCDTDGDGITDYMDYDSDNDGCSDANEAYNNPNADGNDLPFGVYGVGIPTFYDGTSNLSGLVVPAGIDTSGKLYTATPFKTALGNRYTFQQNVRPFAVNLVSRFSNVGGTAIFPASLRATAGSTSPPTQIGTTTSNLLNYTWQVSTNNGATWNNITAPGTSPRYTGFTGTDTIGANIQLTVANIPFGANNWQYRIFITHEANLCGVPSATDSARLRVFLTRPDFLVTYTNVAASGNLKINDSVPSGTSYGNPIALPGNSSACLPVVASNGTYSFTCPTKGKYSFSISVCTPNPSGTCPTELLTITVLDTMLVPPPTANPDFIRTKTGQAITVNVLANDACHNGPTCTLTNPTITMQPRNGTASVNASGAIIFTPNAAFEGNDTLIYRVCDNQTPLAMCDTESVFISVLPNTVPNYTVAVSDFRETIGRTPATGNVLINDYDVEGNTQTAAARTVAVPQGNLVLNSNGSYTFTAVGGFVGAVSFAYTVCDNGTPIACDTASLQILVKAETYDTDPDFIVTTPNMPSSGNVSTNDVVPVGSVYGPPIPQPGNPSACTPVMSANGSYTFTCTVPGEYNFSVPVCPPWQTVGCPTELLTITVVNPSVVTAPPVANPDQITIIAGTTGTLNVLANDKCNNGPNCTLSNPTIVKQPTNGTAIVNGNGTVSMTPAVGFTGKDSLAYRVCDNQTPVPKCDTEFVFITANPAGAMNTTIANDDYGFVRYKRSIAGNVLANDYDPEGNTQTVTPQNIINSTGTFTLASNGTYTFTPSQAFKGPINFVYTVCDNGTPAACDVATINILVSTPECIVTNRHLTQRLK